MIYYEYTTGSFSYDELISGYEDTTIIVDPDAYNMLFEGYAVDKDKAIKIGKVTTSVMIKF